MEDGGDHKTPEVILHLFPLEKKKKKLFGEGCKFFLHQPRKNDIGTFSN